MVDVKRLDDTSAFPELTGADLATSDLFVVFDVSAAVYKSISRAELQLAFASITLTVDVGDTTDLTDVELFNVSEVRIKKTISANHDVTLPACDPGSPGRRILFTDGKGDSDIYRIRISGNIRGSDTYTDLNVSYGWIWMRDGGDTWDIVG